MKRLSPCLIFAFLIAIFVGCYERPSSSDVREAFLKKRLTGQFLSIYNLDPDSIVVKESTAEDVWDITYSEKNLNSTMKTHIQVVPKKRKQGGYLLQVINKEDITPLRPKPEPVPKPPSQVAKVQKPAEPEIDMVTLTEQLKSFAGFTFGADYDKYPPKNRSYHEPGHLRTYYLSSPFRYLDRANLHDMPDRNTFNRRVTVQVTIFGVLPKEYTTEEIHKEYATVAKIVEDKYGIKMKKLSNIHYNFEIGSIKIELWCWGDAHNMYLKVWNAYPFQGVEFRRPQYSAPKKFSPTDGANAL